MRAHITLRSTAPPSLSTHETTRGRIGLRHGLECLSPESVAKARRTVDHHRCCHSSIDKSIVLSPQQDRYNGRPTTTRIHPRPLRRPCMRQSSSQSNPTHHLFPPLFHTPHPINTRPARHNPSIRQRQRARNPHRRTRDFTRSSSRINIPPVDLIRWPRPDPSPILRTQETQELVRRESRRGPGLGAMDTRRDARESEK